MEDLWQELDVALDEELFEFSTCMKQCTKLEPQNILAKSLSP
jgi:hypothetical protein